MKYRANVRCGGSQVIKLCLVLLFLASLPLTGCIRSTVSGDLEVNEVVAESTRRFRKVYLIAPGDRIAITVRNHPEVAAAAGQPGAGFLVRPDGMISLPYLGDFKAAGKSFEQLDTELTEQLATRLQDPDVTVVGMSVREPEVYVIGEVAQPRPVPLRQATTAMHAVAYAGGFLKSANRDAIAVIRLTEDGKLQAVKVPLTLKGQPAPYMALQTTLLQADDVIFIPERNITQIDRKIDEFVNQPLNGVNSVLAPVANFLLIRELIQD